MQAHRAERRCGLYYLAGQIFISVLSPNCYKMHSGMQVSITAWTCGGPPVQSSSIRNTEMIMVAMDKRELNNSEKDTLTAETKPLFRTGLRKPHQLQKARGR